MNWLDIVIITIVAISAILGLFRGAIRTLFGIAGLIVGIFLAGRYHNSLASLLSADGATWSQVAAYAIIVVSVLIIMLVIGCLIERAVHLVMLGWLDKLLGFILGAGLATSLCAAALAIVYEIFPEAANIISQSAIAGFLIAKFPHILTLIPTRV